MRTRSTRRPAEDWTPILSETRTPIADESREALLFQLFNEMGIIDQLSGTAFERVLPHGLTQAQFTVINHCVRLGDGKTPAALAAAFQVTRGTLTSTLQRLEQKRFIELVPDATDGRSKRVMLTEAGRKARDASIRAAFPLLERMRTALSEDEVDQVLPVLVKLRTWLDNNRDV